MPGVLRLFLVGVPGVVLLAAIGYQALVTRAEAIQGDIQARAEAALRRAGADWVTVTTRGRLLELRGAAPDRAAEDAALAAVQGLWGVRRVRSFADVDPLVSPFVWRLTRTAEAITLSGVVPDRSRQGRLHDLAQFSFGRPVEDETEVARGAPEGNWYGAAAFAITQMAELRDGKAVLEDSRLQIGGEPRSRAAAKRVREAVEAGLPGPFEVRLQLRSAEPVAVADAQQLSIGACRRQVEDRLAEQALGFARGSADLTEESATLVEALAAIAARCPEARIEVAGHTDSTGDAEVNRLLSQARAEAVAEALENAGIAGERLQAVGYGASRPIADNDTADGRAKNRRIELTVLR